MPGTSEVTLAAGAPARVETAAEAGGCRGVGAGAAPWQQHAPWQSPGLIRWCSAACSCVARAALVACRGCPQGRQDRSDILSRQAPTSALQCVLCGLLAISRRLSKLRPDNFHLINLHDGHARPVTSSSSLTIDADKIKLRDLIYKAALPRPTSTQAEPGLCQGGLLTGPPGESIVWRHS